MESAFAATAGRVLADATAESGRPCHQQKLIFVFSHVGPTLKSQQAVAAATAGVCAAAWVLLPLLLYVLLPLQL